MMMQHPRDDEAIRAFLAAQWERQAMVRDAASTAAAIEGSLRATRTTRPRPLRAIGVLVILGLLLVTVLAVMIGPGSRRSVVPPISEATATSPAVDPTTSNDPPRLTVPSMVGDIEWTRVPVDDGLYVGGQVDGRFIGETDDGAWFASSDGLAWAPIATPAMRPETVFEAWGDTFAVDSPDGGGTTMGISSHREVLHKSWQDNPGDSGILRRVGDAWVPIDTPDVTPVAPRGTVLRGTRFEGATTLDAAHWLVPSESFIEIPWDAVMREYLDEPVSSGTEASQGMWPIWTEDDERLRLGQPYATGRFTMRVDLVDGDPPTIEFRDDASDALVHSVPAVLAGWTPDALYRGIRYWGVEDRVFLVGHDGQVSLVRPPFDQGEEWVGVTTALGRYYVTSLEPGEDFTVREVHVWESSDGLTWLPVDIPAVPIDRLQYANLHGRPDALLLAIEAADGTSWTWASSDGSTWTAADRPEAGMHEVWATDFGWISNDAFGESAISTDGVHWEPIDRPPVAEPGFTYVAGRLFLRSGDVMWVGRFASGP